LRWTRPFSRRIRPTMRLPGKQEMTNDPVYGKTDEAFDRSEGSVGATRSSLTDLGIVCAATAVLVWAAVNILHPALYIAVTCALTAAVVLGFRRTDRTRRVRCAVTPPE
jgi:hypothetical protein